MMKTISFALAIALLVNSVQAAEKLSREQVRREQVIGFIAKEYANAVHDAQGETAWIKNIHGPFWDYVHKYQDAIDESKRAVVEQKRNSWKDDFTAGRIKEDELKERSKAAEYLSEYSLGNVVKETLRAQLKNIGFVQELEKFVEDCAAESPEGEAGLLYLLKP